MGVNDCLNGAIVLDAIECLNEDTNHPAANLFRGGCETYLQNDASVDPQLLIQIPLRQPLKLSGLKIIGLDAETAPSEVKVFVNKASIGFAEAEDEPATAEFKLEPKECNVGGGEYIIPLSIVKFQNVTHVTIFVASNNADDDITKIRAVELYGKQGENMNIADWKPCKS